jgi:hypothetical protein
MENAEFLAKARRRRGTQRRHNEEKVLRQDQIDQAVEKVKTRDRFFARPLRLSVFAREITASI